MKLIFGSNTDTSYLMIKTSSTVLGKLIEVIEKRIDEGGEKNRK